MKKWLLLLAAHVFADGAFTVGPLINFHLESPLNNSYGLEGSYWFLDGVSPDGPSGIPWGVDLGFESSTQSFSVYSELQVGMGMYGVSVGPVYENSYLEPSAGYLSFQTSVWFNFYLGTAYRYKPSNYYKSSQAISVYLKGLWDENWEWID
jgi:hypothetical protein